MNPNSDADRYSENARGISPIVVAEMNGQEVEGRHQQECPHNPPGPAIRQRCRRIMLSHSMRPSLQALSNSRASFPPRRSPRPPQTRRGASGFGVGKYERFLIVRGDPAATVDVGREPIPLAI